jgi:hypothetical protein
MDLLDSIVLIVGKSESDLLYTTIQQAFSPLGTLSRNFLVGI